MPPVITSIFVGSSSKVPLPPFAASVFAVPWNDSHCLPETSAKPPSPDRLPPLAEIAPPKAVALSDHTITVPPLPETRASAVRAAPGWTQVVWALVMVASLPWKPPPILMEPPPLSPLTSTLAVEVTSTSSAWTVTSPPLAWVPAVMVPDTVALPLPALIATWAFMKSCGLISALESTFIPNT